MQQSEDCWSTGLLNETEDYRDDRCRQMPQPFGPGLVTKRDPIQQHLLRHQAASLGLQPHPGALHPLRNRRHDGDS